MRSLPPNARRAPKTPLSSLAMAVGLAVDAPAGAAGLDPTSFPAIASPGGDVNGGTLILDADSLTASVSGLGLLPTGVLHSQGSGLPDIASHSTTSRPRISR